MDTPNKPASPSQPWFYWPPKWVVLLALGISISSGAMVWDGVAATHQASVTVAPNERGSMTNPEIEPG